jgi:hypothetical protein
VASQKSLARSVLELVDQIDAALSPIMLEMATQWPASTKALFLASSQLRVAAEIRLQSSDNERARRSSSATGSVTAQGGPRD